MREQLLEAAETLVQENGWSAMSFQKLADAVGLKKPSVFHHFASKEDLARALIKRCLTTYGARYGEVLSGKDLNEPAKLREIARIFEEGLRENHLCLLGALSSACGSYSDGLKSELQTTTRLALNRYAKVFEEGRNAGTLRFEGSPEHAAAAFLAMLQGLQIVARAQNNYDAFRPAAASYIDSISH
jgi:TetR/AcrR family transcriptional repressor of nem operon